MATLKKISDFDFDTEKEIFICGKGSSLSKIHNENLEDKIIVCLNSSSIFFPRVDFLFTTDIERFDSLFKLESEVEKIKNIVCPIQMHEFEVPSRFTYLDVFERLREHEANLFTFCLPSQKMTNPKDDRVDKFVFGPEPIYSTYTCSLFWLINAGFKKFKIFGVSTDGVYAEEFLKNGEFGKNTLGSKKIPRSWFQANYNTGIKILRRNDCEFKIY
jgi:hypothetical protein